MPVSLAGFGNALAGPPKSVQDYMAEYDQQDARKLQMQHNALAVQQQQGTMADQQRGRQEAEAVRNALASHQGDMAAAPDVIRRLGTQTAITYADSLEKSILERMKTRSQIGKDDADAGKTRGATVDALLDRYRGHLPYITTPQAAEQWIKAQYSDPELAPFMQRLGAPQEAMSSIPQDPAALDDWKGAIDKKYGEMLLKQQEFGLKKQEFTLKGNNELIGLDGKPNQAVIDTKKGIAAAGKTSVNVGVNTEKSYAGHIAEGLAKNDVSALDAARTAPDRVNTARSIKKVLDSGSAITGTGAEARLWVTKALSTAGVIDGTSTTATEDLVGMLNSQTLDAIKSSGLGSGQGFTNQDREFLQNAKSGRIEINKTTLLRMADLNERAALAQIDYGNKIAGRLKGNPTLGSVGQDLAVKVPDDALSKAIAAEAARRASARGK